MATVSGGVASAAAAAARAAAEGKQAKSAENFYRFQQRDRRRNGESRTHVAAAVTQRSPLQRGSRRAAGSCVLYVTPLLPCRGHPHTAVAELLELRQRFDEGRKRLAALKAARHFKPS